jgi:hypothetical protein
MRLEAKGLLDTRGKLGNPTLGLDGLRHMVRVIAIGLLIFLILGDIGAKPWLQVCLYNGSAHKMISDAATLSEEVSTPSLIPLEANQTHDVWGILGNLPEEGAVTHLMPYIVHAIQLLSAALVLLSEHEEVERKAVKFILICMLRVEGVAVDAVNDVKSGKEVISTAAKRSPGDVEVDHLVLAHGIGVMMNLEGVEVVVIKL